MDTTKAYTYSGILIFLIAAYQASWLEVEIPINITIIIIITIIIFNKYNQAKSFCWNKKWQNP